MMGDTMEELRNRLTPKHLGQSLVAGVKHHPGRAAGVAGAVAGLLAFLILLGGSARSARRNSRG